MTESAVVAVGIPGPVTRLPENRLPAPTWPVLMPCTPTVALPVVVVADEVASATVE